MELEPSVTSLMHQHDDAPERKLLVEERLVKNFLDLIILCKLKECPLYGYDLIRLVHDKFGVYLSPGTVYPVLYGLEKDGLVKSGMTGKKRLYSLVDHSEADTFFSEFKKGCSKLLQFLDIKDDIRPSGLHEKKVHP